MGGGGGGGGGPVSGQTYKLVGKQSGKCLDVPGGSTSDGTFLNLWTCHAATNQKFTLGSLGNGYYKIVNVNSGQCVDIAGGSTADGAIVEQWTCNGADNQAFQFQ